MYHPTTRLLTILELLQARGEMTGRELAQILEVEPRSVRRYVMMLRDMGIPIDAERGKYGGYALRPGFRLPPLMFNADEITAVVMGLTLARDFSPTPIPALESASAKIERVLPAELRPRVEALRGALALSDVRPGAPLMPDARMNLITQAIHAGRCLDLTYTASSGDESRRTVAPYGLVLHGRTWYMPAYCHMRGDKRVFRVDRIRAVSLTEQPFERPAAFDAAAFVVNGLAHMPGTHCFEVVLHAPLSTVREYVAPDLAILEAHTDGTRMCCYTDDPHWLARYLARLEMPFTVLETEQLRAALRVLAGDILDNANR
ncbi:MAG: YafY family transcriptional regulator [Anaerolineae bacterium]|nr:YafY family transcriptional regulator [Anaerolineae bacterium]